MLSNAIVGTIHISIHERKHSAYNFHFIEIILLKDMLVWNSTIHVMEIENVSNIFKQKSSFPIPTRLRTPFYKNVVLSIT